MVLLERESHLAALGEYAAEARAGTGRFVLVAGEAGAGKTSLVDEAETRIPAVWARGFCDPLSTPRPLGPLKDLAPRLDEALAALCRSGASRDDLFEAVIDALSARSDLRVVVIEDAHWADDATLDLVRFLARRVHDLPCLLIVTYRDDEIGVRLQDLLGQLAGNRATRRIDVPMLSPAAVVQLTPANGLDPAELHRTTGGNPFFVTELILAGIAADPPASVRDLVLSRAAALSAGARDVLDTAALLGGDLDPAILSSATGASASSIDEALSSGVVRSTGSGFAFAHELSRVTVDGAIAPHRRVRLHGRILDALREAGVEDRSRLAAHAVGAHDGHSVLEYAPAAGEEAASLGSHREAYAHFNDAARYRDELDAFQRARLLDALGAEAMVIDRGAEAICALEESARLWHELVEPRREGASLTTLSKALNRNARGPESTAAIEEACTLLGSQSPSPELAAALAHLTADRMANGRDDEAIEVGARAVELAERFDLADVLSDSLDSIACARMSGGDWEPLMRRSIEIALDGDAHRQAARAMANLQVGLVDELRLAEAEEVYLEGMPFCEQHDVLTFGWCLRGGQCEVLELLGRWDEAMELAGRVLDTAPTELNRHGGLSVTARILARRGDSRAAGRLEQTDAIARATGQPQYALVEAATQAECAWIAGDVDTARTVIAEAVPHLDAALPLVRGAIVIWAARLSGLVIGGKVPEARRLELERRHVEAAALWDGFGMPNEAALTLAFSSEPADMRHAVARFDRLGAVASADAVRRRMRELGHRSVPTGPQPATKAHPARLTQREQQVLALLAESFSNDEIARRLVISPRTVEHHVSAVLTKLRVDSRARAVRAARDAGLVA